MSSIFISHSSKNNAAAKKVRDWLIQEGWAKTQIFLDLDNLHSGARWRDQLNEFGASCEAVIVCLSDDWLASLECVREFNYAESLGKAIFPIIVGPITRHIPRFITDIQMADVSAPESAEQGYEKLRDGLFAARISPAHFSWPPKDDPTRAPYRGLSTLDEKDAAIFFGRDAEISKGMDALRRMYDRLEQNDATRVFVILGASGAGKSSFLRAGLIPRLMRDKERYLVLPTVRPGQASLTGSLGICHSLGISPEADAAEIIDRLTKIRQQSAASGDNSKSAILIPIDQAEELYNAENVESERAIELVKEVLAGDSRTILLLTIRSDQFSDLQHDRRLSTFLREPFDLRPATSSAFKEIITGPGGLVEPPIEFEASLVERLIADLGGTDSLPLLAFTLERLYQDFKDRGIITLTHYIDSLGGVAGAIDAAVEQAFATAKKNPALPSERVELEALARSTFIPLLVQIDEPDAAPKRQVAQSDEFSDISRILLSHFVAQRIVSLDKRGDDNIYEVCHEAVLRHWGSLSNWIEQDRDALVNIDRLKRASKDYKKSPVDENLIHRGEKLANLKSIEARKDLFDAIDDDGITYLRACEVREHNESQNKARQRLVSRVLPIAAGAALLALFGAYLAVTQLATGFSQWRTASLLPEANRAAELGQTGLALRLALAAVPPKGSVAPPSEDALTMLRVASAVSLVTPREVGQSYKAAAFDPGDRYVYLGDTSGGVTRVSIDAPDPFAYFKLNAGGPVSALSVSPGGDWLAAALRTGQIKLWRLPDDPYSAPNLKSADCKIDVDEVVIQSLVFQPAGSYLLALGGKNGEARGNALVIDTTSCRKAFDIQLAEGSAWPIFAKWSSDNHIVTLDNRWRLQNYIKNESGSYESAPENVSSEDGLDILFSACTRSQCDRATRPVFSSIGSKVAFRRNDEIVVFGGLARSLNSKTHSDPCSDRANAGRAGITLAANAGLEKLLILCDDGRVFAWSPPQFPVLIDTSTMQSVMSNNGTAAVRADLDGNIAISGENQPIRQHGLPVQLNKEVITALAITNDGNHVAFAVQGRSHFNMDEENKLAQLYLLDKNGAVQKIDERTNDITRLQFNHDDTRLLASGWDEKVCTYLISASSGSQRDICIEQSGIVGTDAAWSPDGARIATIGRQSDRPAIWDSANGGALTENTLIEYDSKLWLVRYAASGKQLATGGEDRAIELWSEPAAYGSTVEPGLSLIGHRGTVHDAAFSASGEQLASISADQTLRIWETATGRNIASTIFPARNLAWSQIGLSVLGNNGATIFIDQQLTSTELRERSCDLIDDQSRQFTIAELKKFTALRPVDCAPCENVGSLQPEYWLQVFAEKSPARRCQMSARRR